MLALVDVHELPEVDAAELRLLLERIKRELARPMLVFDADGTIWTGDVGFDLFTAALARKAFRDDVREALASEAKGLGLSSDGNANVLAERLLDAFAEGAYDDARAFAMMAWAFAGFSVDEMEEFAREVIKREEVESRVIPPVRDTLRWAQSQEIEIVICSASPVSIVVAGVQHLGIGPDQILAAVPEVSKSGKLLPRLAPPGMPYGEGKVTALERARPGRPLLAGFGDSGGDAFFLRKAHVPVAVGPSPRLLEQAASIPGLVVLRT